MGDRARDRDREEESAASARKLYPSLAFAELSVYTATWVCGVMYALYSLYLASMERVRRSDFRYAVDTARPWWRFWSSRKMYRDVADHEWSTWRDIAHQVGVYVLLFPVLSWLCKKYLSKYSLLFSVVYSIFVTGKVLGAWPILYIYILIFVMFGVYQLKSPVLVWAVAISYILLLNSWPLQDLKDAMFPDHASQMTEGYLTSVLLAWINARCVSFCLDRIWGRVEPEQGVGSGLLALSAYCFYLPLGIMGPLVTSRAFKQSFSRAPPPLSLQLVGEAGLGLARYGLWFLVTEVSTFITFQQALAYHPHLVTKLSLWALCGMGYAMGQFFHLKYTVMYGFSCHLARTDGVPAPGHPACIGRVHLYSDMWRHFDAGLYEFMRDYIYLPVISTLPPGLVFKLLGSAICFSFVYVWHGTLDFVLIWSVLNFLGISLEAAARALAAHPRYRALEARLSGRMVRRLHALLAAPLLVMSSLSNFYFFAGTTVGHIFVRRILLESWPIGMPTLLAFFYCCCQTSIEAKNYKIKWDILYGRDRRD